MAYELEGQSLEALINDSANAVRAVRRAICFAEELPPRSRLTQDLLEHLHDAEGRALSAWRMARRVRQLVHEANGGQVLAEPPAQDVR